jgi:hypothetical protein
MLMVLTTDQQKSPYLDKSVIRVCGIRIPTKSFEHQKI